MPNYENKKVGVEIEVHETDNPSEIMIEAINFVETQNPERELLVKKEKTDIAYRNAKVVLNNMPQHDLDKCIEATRIVREYEYKDLPF
jgi:hypothetical protein